MLTSSFMEPSSSPSLNPSPSVSIMDPREHELGGNFNLIVIVVAIVCAVVCTLGLNTMLICILQCANHSFRQTVQWVALRGLNSGMKKQDVVALPTSTYTNSGSPTSPSSTSACAICLIDFSNGDTIRVLPNCAHRYHVSCIDKWLLSHSSCPTCRHQLKSKDSIEHIV
ncbi:RING-H2 finger protein ATL74-like [Cucumis melo var. makuwa]|uniref:RING-type E3 ubiquitin transferase n=1 Tax=Cucumis melo var. makuwa TaxID=1194695 RepID=A0A5A7UAN6_CUCMM|nr:RING-H2 finger protein ATL74-like [Cucumis melo var. makuwa]TYK13378.1 RING-H2 finger protein ATL74-like [Cucumis melo var. makuwa]